MVELRHNFILSVFFHMAIIAFFFIFVCRGMEDCVPANIMIVSLLEETTDNNATASFTRHNRQRMRDGTIEETASQEHFLRADRNAFPRSKDEQENNSGDNGGSMTVMVSRDAGASDVHIRTDIDTPPGHSGIERDGNNSGRASPDDLYSSIRDAIAKAKTYPDLARKRKIEGTVVTGFSINDRGYPGNLKIRKSSGYEILDSAALKIVTRAAPFPKVDGQITVPITFKLTESTSSR